MNFSPAPATISRMNGKLSKRFYGAAIIYLIIAIFFLLLHFFQLKRISGVRGNINYIGFVSKETGLSESQVRKMRIFYNGMEIRLSLFKKIRAVTSDGIVHPLKFESFTLQDDGIILHFDNDVNINILSDLHSKKVTLNPELPLTIPPMDRLLIPIQWMEGFKLEYEEDLFLLSRSEEQTYYVTVPADTFLQQDSSQIDLNVSNNIVRDIVLEETLTGTGRTLDDWYEKEGGRNVASVYQREILEYQRITYQSLRSRLNGNGSFHGPEGDNYYSEEAMISLMAEAIDNNLYAGIQEEQSVNAVRNRSRLSYISAPYLGDIVTHGTAMISSDWRLYSQIKEGLETKEFPFFSYPDMYLFFKTQIGLYRELEKLDNIARNNKGDLTDYSYQIERLATLLEMERENAQAERINLIRKDLEEILLQNIFWIKEDLLLFDQQGIAKIEDSIQIGSLLIEFSDVLAEEKLLAAGQKIILTAIKYRDNQGFLPQELILNNSGEAEREGFLHPEKVYQYINLSPYATRRIDLSSQLGPGKWVYTGVSKFTLSSTPRETIISMDFPVGNAHHLVIRGVKPFTEIYLHNRKWKSDQNFQRYSDGWLYDSNRQILYLKVQHQLNTETIRILYYNSETPVVSPITDE